MRRKITRKWNALLALALAPALALPFAVSSIAEAATIPQRVSVQGILKNASGTPVDATVPIEFLFYDAATGGTVLWQDTLSVNVSKGRYGVILGSAGNPITVTVFQTETWLAMNVNADGEMTPRVKVTTAPYAFAAEQANSANTASVALTLGGLLPAEFWLTGGNAGLIDGVDNLFGTTDSAPLRLITAGATRLYVDSTGEVGIGTLTPSSPLTVAGIIETTSGGIKYPDGLVQGWASPSRYVGANSVIGGGAGHAVSGTYTTVGGGLNNTAGGNPYSTVGGGRLNRAIGFYSTVGGGVGNEASDGQSTVGGGDYNTASGFAATVPGGASNTAAGGYSLAAGRRAKANQLGTFVWADSTFLDFNSVAANEFAARATGGFRFVTAVDGTGAPTAGVAIPAGTNSLQAIGAGDLTLGNTTVSGTLSIPTGATVGYVLTSDAGGNATWAANPGSTGWQLAGNTISAGDFLGTVAGNTVPLEFHVDGLRALRIEPTPLAKDAPNIIGGHPANNVTAGVVGATISGGGFNDGVWFYENRVTADYGTVGGGWKNTASGSQATVGGGRQNAASSFFSTVGGGANNTASGNAATVGGGDSNTASGYSSAVGGGYNNWAQAYFATIAGGGPSDTSTSATRDNTNNRVFDDYGTIGGGGYNRVGVTGSTTDQMFATVGGGEQNTASAIYSTVGGGRRNTASRTDSTIGGGYDNLASGNQSTVGGGYNNRASGAFSTVSGGGNSTAGNLYSTIAGGYINAASGYYSTVGGGEWNAASGFTATVGGGERNKALADHATIAGGGPTDLTSDTTRNNTNNRVFDDYGTIGGGGYNRVGMDDGNTTTQMYGTVGGGVSNTASDVGATVGGGSANTASGNASTVGGGWTNTASLDYATIGGGENNTASGSDSTIGGGVSNTASDVGATVGGGSANTASGNASTVGGGWTNMASGDWSTLPGGRENTAAGNYSFAAGRQAKANHAGTFVWADSTAADFASTGGNQFLIRASGGVGIGTSTPNSPLTVAGIIETTSGGIKFPDALVQGWASPSRYGTGTDSVIGGGLGNTASNLYATVGGGNNNTASWYATVGGGQNNIASLQYATVGGGDSNTASGGSATIGGGWNNIANFWYATIGGGVSNTASSNDTTIGGGQGNTASASYATIGGGWSNTASGQYSTVPGGRANSADGDFSFAAGRQAKIDALHDGAFLWADGSVALDFNSAAANEFAARATGGVRFVTAVDAGGNPTAGVAIPSGTNSLQAIGGGDLTLVGNTTVSGIVESTTGGFKFPDGTTQTTAAASAVGMVPVGAVISWLKSMTGTPALSANFVECNGQTLADAASPFNGQVIPDLNGALGTQRFLRGSTTSGTTGGSDSVSISSWSVTVGGLAVVGLIDGVNSGSVSIVPSYYEVLWIMRIK